MIDMGVQSTGDGTAPGQVVLSCIRKAEAGEMAQQLRTLAVLSENPGLAPSTHMATHNCDISSRRQDGAEAYMQTK